MAFITNKMYFTIPVNQKYIRFKRALKRITMKQLPNEENCIVHSYTKITL